MLWSCDQIGWFSVTMVSVCLPSDALSQHLPSYLGFFLLGHGYLFMAAPAKHSRCSLPWMWVCSSQPPPLAPSKDPTCHNQDPELCKYLPLLSSHNFIISVFFLIVYAFHLFGIEFEFGGFPGGSDNKECACQCRRPRFNPWVGKTPRRKEWQPTPAFLPGESHGQRSLVGYGPWGRIA